MEENRGKRKEKIWRVGDLLVWIAKKKEEDLQRRDLEGLTPFILLTSNLSIRGKIWKENEIPFFPLPFLPIQTIYKKFMMIKLCDMIRSDKKKREN